MAPLSKPSRSTRPTVAAPELSRTRDSRPGARKLAFAVFVKRALETARSTRAWNASEASRRTGVSRQTVNRWVRGDWASDPEPERVLAFCEGLGVNAAAAFAILEWDAAPQPAMDPDVAALQRRLADPRVGEAEKFHIRETVRYLAYRPIVTTTSDAATGKVRRTRNG